MKERKVKITENSIEILSEEERKELSKEDAIKRKKTVRKDEKKNYSYVPERKSDKGPEKKGTIKFARSNGGRRNNRRAMLAELDDMDN